MNNIDYLRVSVTDRCNLRCVYCYPLGDCNFIDRSKVLRFEEIERIVRVFAKCGIRKIRLTGGEPLIRKNIAQLISRLAEIDDIEQLSLTTNGVLLESMADELKSAGLDRVNISVDSAEPDSYKQITGFSLLGEVTRGIYKALEVGLEPVKINSVIIKGLNDSERQIQSLAQISIHLPVSVRFIEYYPTDKYTRPGSDYVPNREVREIIECRFGSLSNVVVDGRGGPALYFKIKNAAGSIGFINGRSSVFCQSCNRLRLTSDGKIRSCLYSVHDYDLRGLIRNGADDTELRSMIEKIISEKGNFTKLNSPVAGFSMRKVGG